MTRLRQAWEERGYTGATEAWQAHAKRLGISKDLFISNSNGNRSVSKKMASVYADVFGYDAAFYLYDDKPPSSRPSDAAKHSTADPEVGATEITSAAGDAALDAEGDAVFISGRMERFYGPRDVEKVGVVAAGDDGDFSMNGEIIERVMRPRGLIGRPGVWAMEIISDSMYPAHRKGDVIFCEREPPKVGEDVVIELFPEVEDGPTKAYIKRLKRRSAGVLLVEQFNPPKDITFDPYAVRHIWRVVPNGELHGF